MDIGALLSDEAMTSATRAVARAEAAQFSAMLAFRDAEETRIARLESPMRQLVERSAIPMSIGQAMGLSENQVWSRLATADRMVAHAPTCWAAFCEGLIDAARVREISTGLDRLERETSWVLLDEKALAYATTHTTAELRAWVKRFVTRVEPDEALDRAEKARDQRHVSLHHLEDGCPGSRPTCPPTKPPRS